MSGAVPPPQHMLSWRGQGQTYLYVVEVDVLTAVLAASTSETSVTIYQFSLRRSGKKFKFQVQNT